MGIKGEGDGWAADLRRETPHLCQQGGMAEMNSIEVVNSSRAPAAGCGRQLVPLDGVDGHDRIGCNSSARATNPPLSSRLTGPLSMPERKKRLAVAYNSSEVPRAGWTAAARRVRRMIAVR